MAFPPPGGGPFAFAGLWEVWRPAQGPPLLSCALLTTAANELVGPIHGRMPVIIHPHEYSVWMDRGKDEPAELLPLLRPMGRRGDDGRVVGPWVNDARHEGPQCLAPLV